MNFEVGVSFVTGRQTETETEAEAYVGVVAAALHPEHLRNGSGRRWHFDRKIPEVPENGSGKKFRPIRASIEFEIKLLTNFRWSEKFQKQLSAYLGCSSSANYKVRFDFMRIWTCEELWSNVGALALELVPRPVTRDDLHHSPIRWDLLSRSNQAYFY